MFASMCLLLEAKETLIAQAVSGYLRSVEFGKGASRPNAAVTESFEGRYPKGCMAACGQPLRCLAAHGTRAVIASGSLLKGHVTSEFGMFDSSRSQKAIGGYHQT